MFPPFRDLSKIFSSETSQRSFLSPQIWDKKSASQGENTQISLDLWKFLSFLLKLVSLFLATFLSDFRKAVLRPLTSWIVAVQLKIHFPFSQTYLYKNKHIQAFWKQNFQLSPLFLVVLSRMGWNAAIDSLVTNREKRDYFCFCPCFI